MNYLKNNKVKYSAHTHTHTVGKGDMQPGPSLGFATFGSSRLFIIWLVSCSFQTF